MGNRDLANTFIATLIGLLMAIALLEIAGRLLPVNTGFRAGMNYMRFHPATGYELNPAASPLRYRTACLDVEPVTIDAESRRNVPFEPATEELRIAVLGDSFMMAREVGDNEHFAAVLARLLGNARVDNYGVPGYGTIQQFLTYRDKASDTRPDITILALFDGNDIADNSARLSVRDPLGVLRPFFAPDTRELRYTREQNLQDEEQLGAAARLHRQLNHSSFTYFAINKYVLKPLAGMLEQQEPAGVSVPGAGTAAAESRADGYWWERDYYFPHIAPYQQEPDEIWEQAWLDTELALTQLNEAVREDGGQLILMLIPHTRGTWLDVTLKKYEEVFGEPAPPGFDPDYPKRRLSELAKREGFRVLNLAPVFEDYAERHPDPAVPFYFRCDGHWNPVAHYIAANAMLGKLAEHGDIARSADPGESYLEESPEDLLGPEATRQIFGWGNNRYSGDSDLNRL